eukprot:6188135-Pleurochrysis_carterae.AAC.2
MLSRQNVWLLMLIQRSLLQLYRVACAVSPGKELTSNTFWKRGRELPPFKVDNDSAVDFLLAAVDQSTARKSECACVRTHQNASCVHSVSACRNRAKIRSRA